MAIQLTDSKHPHIKWMDVHDNGTLVECAIMKVDPTNGDVAFFVVPSLDDIDKRRLLDIINDRNADHFELWDLMKQHTLRNGMNALDYFHQLVKVKTAATGAIITPQSGKRGAIAASQTAVVAAERAADAEADAVMEGATSKKKGKKA